MRRPGKSFAVWPYGLVLFWGMGGSAHAGGPAGDAKSFIDDMLSQDGQRIVEGEGFIPVSR